MNEDYIKRENVLNADVLKQNPTTDVEKNLNFKFCNKINLLIQFNMLKCIYKQLRNAENQS